MTDRGHGAPTKARVVDMETTGLPEEGDLARICEIGFIDVDMADPNYAPQPWTARSMLVHPGVEMRPEIMAVHHIADLDLFGAPPVSEGLSNLFDGLEDDDLLVAHNAKMEQHFIPFVHPQRWVDTYRCALRAWPEAPGHSNQVLRYWLASKGLLELDRHHAEPPHRALPDAYVTAHIFSALMKLGRPVERLLEISGQPGFLPAIRFGKHSGMKFSDLPLDYLQWMVRQEEMDADAVFTAKYWLRQKS